MNQLLSDIERLCADRVSLVITQNIADPVALETQRRTFPVELIVNARKKGFGANHNTAFERCRTAFFCVANPDLRFTSDPFLSLLDGFAGSNVGVAGPLVRNASGAVEDSARHFPTLPVLIHRFFTSGLPPDYPIDAGATRVDWIAGMFMLFSADVYRAVGGFDEAFFMYYEDADICRRIRAAGKSIVYDPRAEIVHETRRASRRNPRLALHHIASAIRFLSRS